MTLKCATRLLIVAGLVTFGVAGCGDSGSSTEPPPSAGVASPNAPRLLTDLKSPGEFVFQAEYSPETFGPIELDGSYTVRFAQYAPEDAEMDFGSQTVFMAKLTKVSGAGPDEIPLFSNAARTGQTQVDADGSYEVEVTFGDFPFVVRLTPV